MPSVLFVCTANICRSPMASALFRHLLESDPDGNEWRVESAGTWALEGRPAAEKSLQVLEKLGLDLRAHRSRSVDLPMLRSFDLILTMEAGHKEALCAEFPELAGRVFRLSEMAGLEYDIEDPFGGPLPDFEKTAAELQELLSKSMACVRRLAAASPSSQN
jgi:protein-tyrosine-phosphatase